MLEARIRKGRRVKHHEMLERKPGVVVYSEYPIVRMFGLRGSRPKYVFLAGNDAKHEANKIYTERPGKVEDAVEDFEVEYQPYYLHLVGSSDYRYWSEEEIQANLLGYSKLQEKEEALRKKYKPERNLRKGGGGRNPAWVEYCRARLSSTQDGFSTK